MMMFFQGLMTLLRMIEKHMYVGKLPRLIMQMFMLMFLNHASDLTALTRFNEPKQAEKV